MAKPIYISTSDVDGICAELRSYLLGSRCYGSISINKTIQSDKRKAVLRFTPNAWIKMTELVARFRTEVQWHGLVSRLSESEFEVYDIIVPPHEVSGSTVTSEYAPYIEWLDDIDDGTFLDIRFHGHSHVNMDVHPSSVDEKYRTDLVTQLQRPGDEEDVFYIFMILNKSHEINAQIYDLTNNVLYDTDDISIDHGVEDDIGDFILDSKSVAVERKYPVSTSGTWSTSSSDGVHGELPKDDDDNFKELKRYYKSIYGEEWRKYVDFGDYEEDPTSPFYVKEFGYEFD